MILIRVIECERPILDRYVKVHFIKTTKFIFYIDLINSENNRQITKIEKIAYQYYIL